MRGRLLYLCVGGGGTDLGSGARGTCRTDGRGGIGGRDDDVWEAVD